MTNNSNNGNDIMKTLGIILMVIGLGIALYTGLNSDTRDQVADVSNVELTDNRENDVDWGPYAGIGLMVIGGVLYYSGRKKTDTDDRNSVTHDRNSVRQDRNSVTHDRKSVTHDRNSDDKNLRI